MINDQRFNKLLWTVRTIKGLIVEAFNGFQQFNISTTNCKGDLGKNSKKIVQPYFRTAIFVTH